MGQDFAALVRYNVNAHFVDHIVNILESDERPKELLDVASCWKRMQYGDRLDRICPEPTWVIAEDHYTKLAARPTLPTYAAHLGGPEGFFFTFGQDVLVVKHLLRWRQFLLHHEWQQTMLNMIRWLCECIHADACILINDCHPAFIDAQKGTNKFDEIINNSIDNGAYEIKHLGGFRDVDIIGSLDERLQAFWRYDWRA